MKRAREDLAAALLARVEAGEWPTGMRLPTQTELAGSYGVSRHVVRGAIELLEQRGAVESRQGSGIYARGALIDYHVRWRTRYGENVEREGPPTRIELLHLQTCRGDDAATRALALPRGARVYDLHILRWSGADPLCIAHHLFPADRYPDLPDQLDGIGGISELLSRLGIADFRRSQTAIWARRPTRSEAEMLRVAIDSSVLSLEGRNIDMKGVPVEISRSIWPASRIRVHV